MNRISNLLLSKYSISRLNNKKKYWQFSVIFKSQKFILLNPGNLMSFKLYQRSTFMKYKEAEGFFFIGSQYKIQSFQKFLIWF